ncbi:MAG TPA: hypothetical protein VGU74_07845 [Gemmatimonadales bacterium]|nr:hypothetical protein [Gemmatimonadales bacterium]
MMPPVAIHAQLMLRVLLDERARPSLSGVNWELIERVARHHTVLVRVTDRFMRSGAAPRMLVRAAVEERARGHSMLTLLQHIQSNAARHGIAWMAPKAWQRFPDVGDDVDVLVFSDNAATDRLLLDGLPVTRQEPSLTARVAANTLYSIATGGAGGGGDGPAASLVFDVRHGRVGSAGQHAAFAKTLDRNARAVIVGGTEFRIPSVEDQLVLQGLEKVTGRRSFHLCDVVQTIEILRAPQLDWDYVVATARSHGGLEGLGCYLSYADYVNERLLGSPLLPVPIRRRFASSKWGYPSVRETGFYFPALQVTGRIQGRQLGRSLVRGDWDAALRLTLWPLAAITERMRGS